MHEENSKRKNSKILKKDFYIHETIVSMPKKHSKDNRKTNK